MWLCSYSVLKPKMKIHFSLTDYNLTKRNLNSGFALLGSKNTIPIFGKYDKLIPGHILLTTMNA